MLKLVKGFLKEEEGMGTIEIVVIIAVLVALALLFKDQIGKFANNLMQKFFNADGINGLDSGTQLPNNP